MDVTPYGCEEARVLGVLRSIRTQMDEGAMNSDEREMDAVLQIAELRRKLMESESRCGGLRAENARLRRQVAELEALLEEPDILDAVFGDTPPCS